MAPKGYQVAFVPEPVTRARLDCRGKDHYSDHMTRRVTATEAKAKILALLDEVAAGDEVEIMKRGRIVARLIPAAGPHSLRGRLTGVAMSAADDEQLFSIDATWKFE